MGGGGRGMGGGGRCMGGGRGMGQGRDGYYATPSAKTAQVETLAELKAQATELQQQMTAINSRIKQMKE